MSRGLCPCLGIAGFSLWSFSLTGRTGGRVIDWESYRVGKSRFHELRSSGIIKIASVKAATPVGFFLIKGRKKEGVEKIKF